MANDKRQTLKEKDSEKEIYPNIISDCIPVDAVKTSHIKNGAITTEKIEDGAVTDEKISGTFGKDRIADNSISKEKIENGAVTTVKIANGAVTLDKISNITQGSTVATQEYVDEHGGGGGGNTLYKHFIHLTFTDGCDGEYDINGWVILESTSNTQFTATTFKALFDSSNIFGENDDTKIMTMLSNQYIKVGYDSLMACCYNYSSTDDYFNCEASYSGELTLATITDTVTSV